jgi:osmoprotectant transport system substrate-binding protein
VSRQVRRRLRVAVAPGVCAAGLLLAGCGSGAVGQGASTSTGTVATNTSTAASNTTTTALPGSGKPAVVLGDKNTTEQFILGELYDLALSAQGYSVTLTRNIGPPAVTYQALQQGNLNLYPEYLNVWDAQVVRTTTPIRSVDDAYLIGQTWAAEHQLALLVPTPGSDTNGIAVTTAYANANHLRTLAGLGRVSPTLKIGVPLQFAQSSAGLPALEETYGFTPASTSTIVIGDQYHELQSGQIQAAYAQTTDAELSTSQFRLLGDPRHVNGFGNVVPVVTASTLAAEGTTFVDTINQVDDLLTTRVLRVLNADVDLLHEDPRVVAKQFLEDHNLVPSTTP